MVYSLYLRDKAEQALRLARDSTDQVLVKGLIEDAAEYLGRAEAIDLVESLKEVGCRLRRGSALRADISHSLRSG
jgi:hypothetical protein